MVAVQVPPLAGAPASVVLVQTSVTADYTTEHNASSESLFALVRQSLRYEGPAGAAALSSGALNVGGSTAPASAP